MGIEELFCSLDDMLHTMLWGKACHVQPHITHMYTGVMTGWVMQATSHVGHKPHTNLPHEYTKLPTGSCVVWFNQRCHSNSQAMCIWQRDGTNVLVSSYHA